MNDGKRKRYRIADAEIEIAFTENYTEIICRDYEVKAEGKPDFVIEVTDEEVEREKKKSEPGASKGIIESLAIYRKLCEKILDRNCVLFHCSAVAVDGKAYLFTAASGTGKSTHTRMWRQHFGGRAVMVNDDKPILRINLCMWNSVVREAWIADKRGSAGAGDLYFEKRRRKYDQKNFCNRWISGSV